MSEVMDIIYQAHVEGIGWQDPPVENGQIAGTVGKSLRMEAIKIKLNHAPEGVGVTYRAYVEDKGWMPWVDNWQIAGTTGESLRIEAMEIKLTGVESGGNLGVMYHSQQEGIGWTPFVANGAETGTTGQSRRLEAIQIVLAYTTLKDFS